MESAIGTAATLPAAAVVPTGTRPPRPGPPATPAGGRRDGRSPPPRRATRAARTRASGRPVVRPCRNPAAYRSPAPVVSTSCSTVAAGTSTVSSAVTTIEPCSERVITTISDRPRTAETACERSRVRREREDLLLVREQHVHVVLHQRAELVEVALDAERVRQRERHAAAGAVRRGHRDAERLLGARLVPEVALQVRHGAPRHQVECRRPPGPARRPRRGRWTSCGGRPASPG